MYAARLTLSVILPLPLLTCLLCWLLRWVLPAVGFCTAFNFLHGAAIVNLYKQWLTSRPACCSLLVGDVHDAAVVNLYNQCLTSRPACCSLLVGDVHNGPGCIGWGLQQPYLVIHCWPVFLHLFASHPGLPQLTAVFWAACVLYLCTVQVPCYDVGRSLAYISKPGGCWQHLPRPGEACC
jgi:hypothetical protein